MLEDKIENIVDILENTEDKVEKLSNKEILNHKELNDENFVYNISNIIEIIDNIDNTVRSYEKSIKDKGMNQLDITIENIVKIIKNIYNTIDKKIEIKNNYIDKKFDTGLLQYKLEKIVNLLDELEIYIENNNDVISNEILNDVYEYSVLTNNKLNDDKLSRKTEILNTQNELTTINDHLNFLKNKLKTDISGNQKKSILKQISNIKNATDGLLDNLDEKRNEYFKNVSDIKYITKNVNGFFDFNIDLYMREKSYNVYKEQGLSTDEKYDMFLLADKMFDNFKNDILNGYFLSSGKMKLKNIPSEIQPFVKKLFDEDFYNFLTNNDYESSFREKGGIPDDEFDNEEEEDDFGNDDEEDFNDDFDEDFDGGEEDEESFEEEGEEDIPEDDLTDF